jgi:hypothetical protein
MGAGCERKATLASVFTSTGKLPNALTLSGMSYLWIPTLKKIFKREWRKAMDEKLKIDQLFNEKALAEALGVSRSSLRNLRNQGCPWVSLFGKAYYHGQLFMKWILENKLRTADPSQLNTKQQSFDRKRASESEIR